MSSLHFPNFQYEQFPSISPPSNDIAEGGFGNSKSCDVPFHSHYYSPSPNASSHSMRPSQPSLIETTYETPLLCTSSVENKGMERHRRPWFGEGSLKSSIFNLTNATLGAGIVSVPFAMKSLGLLLNGF